jgi:hypothetical protein
MATKTKKKPPPKKRLPRRDTKYMLDDWCKRVTEDEATRKRELLERQVEDAAKGWYAIARGRLEDIYQVTSSMASRIEKDPDCFLARIFDADELQSFAGHLGDTISYLQNVYPLIGEGVPDPVKALGREVTAGDCATA